MLRRSPWGARIVTDAFARAGEQRSSGAPSKRAVAPHRRARAGRFREARSLLPTPVGLPAPQRNGICCAPLVTMTSCAAPPKFRGEPTAGEASPNSLKPARLHRERNAPCGCRDACSSSRRRPPALDAEESIGDAPTEREDVGRHHDDGKPSNVRAIWREKEHSSDEQRERSPDESALADGTPKRKAVTIEWRASSSSAPRRWCGAERAPIRSSRALRRPPLR